METKIYQVWIQGYQHFGMSESVKASLYGEVEAESFNSACDKLGIINDADTYNSELKTAMGRRLFEYENDARKWFG